MKKKCFDKRTQNSIVVINVQMNQKIQISREQVKIMNILRENSC